MTVHRLGAGDGYRYLTRQVASADTLHGWDLTGYYAATGNPPGVWYGQGAAAAGISGQIREDQMARLYGQGLHPNSGAPLGRRWYAFRPFEERLADRIAAHIAAHGAPPDAEEVDRIRLTELRKERQAVAGWDMVFTPVKSVSVLWALGDPTVRGQVEAAHRAAWQSVLDYADREIALTRRGIDGVAQIETRGLIAAAFDHYDSRAGDPNLHTHVVVSNKVRGVDGRWRSLDATALHKAAVALSERYTTSIEAELARRLGVAFADRSEPGVRGGTRPVREIAGVPEALRVEFSTRRVAIDTQLARLVADYRTAHGYPPDAATMYRLSEQATLATRAAKTLTSLDAQRAQWRERAVARVGRAKVNRLLAAARAAARTQTTRGPQVDALTLARDVLATVQEGRATWSRWHVEAEAHRRVRQQPGVTDPAALVTQVTTAALAPGLSLPLTAPDLGPTAPDVLRRQVDGQVVFDRKDATVYTSAPVLAAEDRLVAATRTPAGHAVDPLVAAAVAARAGLSDEQAIAVRRMVTADQRLAVLIGPAGAGKTTTMRAVVEAWQTTGRPVLALAPSQTAAAVLAEAIGGGIRAENTAKWLHESEGPGRGGPDWQMQPGTLVLVDEASLAGTLALDRIVAQAAAAGAAVRLIGDHRQLDAVEAGGALRLLATDTDAVELGSR